MLILHHNFTIGFIRSTGTTLSPFSFISICSYLLPSFSFTLYSFFACRSPQLLWITSGSPFVRVTNTSCWGLTTRNRDRNRSIILTSCICIISNLILISMYPFSSLQSKALSQEHHVYIQLPSQQEVKNKYIKTRRINVCANQNPVLYPDP